VLAYGGTAAANVYGLTPALSRLRGTYALMRSGGGVRSRWSLTSPRYAHRREVPVGYDTPGTFAAMCSAPNAGRYALCGYGRHRMWWVERWTQRQAARGRA